MTTDSHGLWSDVPELDLENSPTVANPAGDALAALVMMTAQQNELLTEAVTLLRGLTAAAQALLAPAPEPDDITPPDTLVDCPVSPDPSGPSCELCGGTGRVPKRVADQWHSPT